MRNCFYSIRVLLHVKLLPLHYFNLQQLETVLYDFLQTPKSAQNISMLNQPYSEYNCTRWHFALGAHVGIATKPVHRLQICPIVHNYGELPTISPKLHPGPCSIRNAARDRQTHRQTAVTTIHFAWLCLMRNVTSSFVNYSSFNSRLESENSA